MRVEDRDVREWDPIALRRRTGYVIQDVGLFPHLTVAGNIATRALVARMDAARIATRVAELLSLVGLEPTDFRARWPDELRWTAAARRTGTRTGRGSRPCC